MIAGAGGIGHAAAVILSNYKAEDLDIFIGDRFLENAEKSASEINSKTGRSVCSPFLFPEEGENDDLSKFLERTDVILDCLPGSQAPRLAELAKKYNCHYANLTEYVRETDMVTEIAESCDTGFVLQTGLAPGYINVLANHLFQRFTEKYKVDKVDTIEMKVGALSKHAPEPYFYAYTWSPIGVATEYVKQAIVVDDYETKYIPSLSKTEMILIDGVAYEDDYTSGGAADLPKALAGKTKNLRYKTLRYPGHYKWVRSVLKETPEGEDKVAFLNRTMQSQIPAVEDDVVVVFASVKGQDSGGQLRSLEKSIFVNPSKINGIKLRAIQTTTAAPLCQMALLLLENKLKGPIFQSQIPALEFLNGEIVSSVFGEIDE